MLINRQPLSKIELKLYAHFYFSDGLGFSGVYIAVDIGIKSHEESKTSVVDVFELSKNLRRDRHGIVCALEQYNFIYQVCMYVTATGLRCLSVSLTSCVLLTPLFISMSTPAEVFQF